MIRNGTLRLLCILFFPLACSFSIGCGAVGDLHGDRVVRVAISDGTFKSFSYDSISFVGTGKLCLRKKSGGVPLVEVGKNQSVKIAMRGGEFDIVVSASGRTISGIGEPIVVECSEGLIGICGLQRCQKQTLYRGAFELVKAKNGQFFAINVVALEDYLLGVVPNEMPLRLGLEALKAQAVLARNYALKPRTRPFGEFELFDSVASQVYFGAASEYPLSTKAVQETEGVVATHNSNMVLALYHSTAGGWTENFENVFSDEESGKFPGEPDPCLVGSPDYYQSKNLQSEEVARRFYKTRPKSYDSESKFFRWTREWGVEELEKVLSGTLLDHLKSGFVRQNPAGAKKMGKLRRIDVLRRGVSGKIMELNVVTDAQTFYIQKESLVRHIFKKNGESLPSANVVFECALDRNGNLKKIIAYGGGFGHGVGMSQCGAGFMATHLGKTFDQILNRYISGIKLSTIPVTFSSGNGNGNGDAPTAQVKQSFWLPKKSADLIIVPIACDGAAIPLQIKINGKAVRVRWPKVFPSENVTRINVSKRMKNGRNTVEFVQSGERGWSGSLKLYIEFS
jgi:SpoIID/LytB domain protein